MDRKDEPRSGSPAFGGRKQSPVESVSDDDQPALDERVHGAADRGAFPARTGFELAVTEPVFRLLPAIGLPDDDAEHPPLRVAQELHHPVQEQVREWRRVGEPTHWRTPEDRSRSRWRR